jgi:hypothetical protein
MLTKEANRNFIKRVLEIEQELIRYPENKKRLDMELISLARNYNKAHKFQKKTYKVVQVQEVCDIVQVRFSFRKEASLDR